MNDLMPGTEVRVNFGEKGCACGCTRIDGYVGVIVAEDTESYRRPGTVRVRDALGVCRSEFERHVIPLDAEPDAVVEFAT